MIKKIIAGCLLYFSLFMSPAVYAMQNGNNVPCAGQINRGQTVCKDVGCQASFWICNGQRIRNFGSMLVGAAMVLFTAGFSILVITEFFPAFN
ncbi:MAG: hypothetical protein LBN01_04415 [Endomicrobium sp.]|jgi:hypothetical protein|nr:hypothetical protein [Endomicrobium sp.]